MKLDLKSYGGTYMELPSDEMWSKLNEVMTSKDRKQWNDLLANLLLLVSDMRDHVKPSGLKGHDDLMRVLGYVPLMG